MLIALFVARRKGLGGCKAHKSLETMLSVPGEACLNPMKLRFHSIAKGQSWSSCPGQRPKVSVQTWGLVSAKLRGAWRFKGERRSLGNSCWSVFIVSLIGCPGDGVGLFLVVCLQHVILVFDRSVGKDKKGLRKLVITVKQGGLLSIMKHIKNSLSCSFLITETMFKIISKEYLMALPNEHCPSLCQLHSLPCVGIVAGIISIGSIAHPSNSGVTCSSTNLPHSANA